MSVIKLVSLGIGAISALLTAAMLLYFQATGWAGDHVWETSALIAVAVGLVVGFVHSSVSNWYASELRRMAEHVTAIARNDSDTTPLTYRRQRQARHLGMNQVVDAVENATGRLTERIERLVSQRRELEVQLRIADSERQHVEAILDAMSDAVLVTDAFNELALANEAAERLLHFDVDEASRKPVDQVVSDPFLVKLIKDTREGAAPGAALRRHVEHRLASDPSHAFASIYDVTLTSVSRKSDSRASVAAENGGVVTILRDVTREKEIAEMKSDFVSSVSHEMRTPLSSIKAYVEMLIDGEAADDATREEFYHIIQGETNRLQRLIDNILNISRIESGVVKVHREHIPLPKLIHDAMEVMRPQARAKQQELLDVTSPLQFQVFADRDMIHQVLINLIGNAIKYTGEGGQITVTVEPDPRSRQVHVLISDTGAGIPAEAIPQLFDKFYRVNDHKKLARGTGLGLSLVKQIVETVHGGKVWATSEVGRGSTFTFSLPLADNE